MARPLRYLEYPNRRMQPAVQLRAVAARGGGDHRRRPFVITNVLPSRYPPDMVAGGHPGSRHKRTDDFVDH